MSLGAFFEAFYVAASGWINYASQLVDALPVSYAFAAGMLATVNPCGFVMLPAFAAFYTTLDSNNEGLVTLRRLERALRMGVLVTVAFVAVFGSAGVLITLGGRALLRQAGWAGLVVGALLAGLGLYQLIMRRSLFANATAGMRVQRIRSARGVLLFGLAYAICSLGCTLPAFLVVAGSVFLGDRDFVHSLSRFVQYALGMGSVLTLIAVGVALMREQTTRWTRRVLPAIDGAANVLLVLAGMYIVWYWASKGSIL